MIFGVLNPEKIWHQELVHVPTSPVYCNHVILGNPKKSFFQQYYPYIQIIYVISKENRLLPLYPPHLKTVTPLPCKMYFLSFWLYTYTLSTVGWEFFCPIGCTMICLGIHNHSLVKSLFWRDSSSDGWVMGINRNQMAGYTSCWSTCLSGSSNGVGASKTWSVRRRLSVSWNLDWRLQSETATRRDNSWRKWWSKENLTANSTVSGVNNGTLWAQNWKVSYPSVCGSLLFLSAA